jgi:hypothetical protein
VAISGLEGARAIITFKRIRRWKPISAKRIQVRTIKLCISVFSGWTGSTAVPQW